MKQRVTRPLLSVAGATAVALAALACDTVTEPLPDPPFHDEQATVGADSTGAPPADTTSSPGDTLAPPTDTTAWTPLPADEIESLFSGTQSGIEDERTQVVEDDAAWAAVWSELHAALSSEPARPTVDFGDRRVVVVATGPRPTGGHRLELVGVTTEESDLQVAVEHVAPAPGCLTTQEVTRPALALSVPRTEGDVLVSVERVYACG